MKKRISAQESAFVANYVKTGNAAEAYRNSYSTQNLSPLEIGQRGNKVKRRKHVIDAIEKLQRSSEKQLEFGIQEVLQEWRDIALADPAELNRVMRRCCRYCYGRGHAYQYKNGDEFAHALAAWMRAPAKTRGEPPSDEGGYGFNFTFRPHPECTECRGEGHLDTFFSDTRTLSPRARKLFAGVKLTKNGLEVMTRDQDAALANYARFLGMFTDKVQLTGAGGGPLISANVALPTDPVEAANAYAELIKSTSRK